MNHSAYLIRYSLFRYRIKNQNINAFTLIIIRITTKLDIEVYEEAI